MIMKAYNLLLHLYPASFRNEYGEEMREVFARRQREATGPFGRAAIWLGAVPEVAGNAALVHRDILKQDLSYTGRILRRSPGFAITAILMVALGIGATTAAFSVTDFVLIRPLPFPEPAHLIKIWETTPGYPRIELSAPNYRDWKAAAKSFESMGVYHFESITITTSGEPRRLSGTSVSGDLFHTLGVAPVAGRTFTDADDVYGAPGTIILSYRLWQTEFGGDPAVIGRNLVAQVDVDAAPYTVIGVMPREFHFPKSDVLFWITNRFGEGEYRPEERADNWLEAVGRLRPGVTLEQARAEMDVIAAQLRQAYPKENKNTGATVMPLGTEVSERSRLLLLALSGAAGCLLLIACTNLTNLLLARALSRRRELAVRTAIGAGRERLVRQLMTESLLLAAVGGALGIAIAVASVPLLTKLVPQTLPIAASPSVDIRVLLFAVALTALTGIAFGLAPVFRTGASSDLDGLREGVRAGSGRKERLRAALVVTEIIASVVLLVSAGLLIRALLAVQAIDPGFEPEGVLTMRTELPMPEYGRVVAREAYYARVLQDLRTVPGVKSAGFVSFLPISSFRGGTWPVTVTGDSEAGDGTRSANNVAAIRFVTPGYFDTLSIPVKRGRDVTDSDSRGRQFVAIVSESFVKRYWPNQDPIGHHFSFGFSVVPFIGASDWEIVGVVGDVRFRGLERVAEPQVYLSSRQVPDDAITFYAPRALAVRTRVPPANIAPAIRAAVRRADPKLPITEMQTLADLVDLETASRAVQVRVLSAFAIVAFILAAIGMHGLLSFAVSQRVQEIGVRRALGAQSRDILSMVVWRGVILAIAGVIPGVALSYAVGRSMEALLAGVRPADALTLASAVGLTVLMALIGSLAPTLRALRVDPITALRAE
jgi:putative ABC transport system permease protein